MERLHNLMGTGLIASHSVFNRIIAIDVDGTLIEDAKNFPEFGPVKKGAQKALRILRENGYIVMIFTLRTSTFIKNIEDIAKEIERLQIFLDDNNLEYDFIWTGKGKPPARVFIDDRAVKFTDKVGWEKITEMILNQEK